MTEEELGVVEQIFALCVKLMTGNERKGEERKKLLSAVERSDDGKVLQFPSWLCEQALARMAQRTSAPTQAPTQQPAPEWMHATVALPTVENKAEFLGFTEQEISKMPKQFRKEFRVEGCTARVRKRKVSKNAYTYEIRYRRNGYNVSVSGKTLDIAKEKFIKALHDCETPAPKTITPEPTTATVSASTTAPTVFNDFADYFYEHYYKKKVVEKTWYIARYRLKTIKEEFEGKTLTEVTPTDCQIFIDRICARTPKTGDDVHSLLNQIFKYAVAHGLLMRNPLDVVLHVQHERKHGKAFTMDEERRLIALAQGTKYFPAVLLGLYAGLRPCELSTARIEGDFIIAENAKRKNKIRNIVSYKKIPITPMMAPYRDIIDGGKIVSTATVQAFISSNFPNHRLYDLRTTFYTHCQECGVAEVARKTFAGHSLGVLADSYTDLSDAFLLKEGNKIKY